MFFGMGGGGIKLCLPEGPGFGPGCDELEREGKEPRGAGVTGEAEPWFPPCLGSLLSWSRAVPQQKCCAKARGCCPLLCPLPARAPGGEGPGQAPGRCGNPGVPLLRFGASDGRGTDDFPLPRPG